MLHTYSRRSQRLDRSPTNANIQSSLGATSDSLRYLQKVKSEFISTAAEEAKKKRRADGSQKSRAESPYRHNF